MKGSTYIKLSLLLVLLLATGVFGGVSAQDGDTLNIIYWQAASSLNPYLSGGTKEIDAASVVIEPLALYDDNGALTTRLAVDIPTVANGGVAEDLTTITWQLQEGLVWSDGTPVTAADAVFTWRYCTDPETGCAQSQFFEDIASVEAVDDLTIRITFSVPKPFPYGPFVSNQSPLIQQAQFADCIGAAAPNCTEQNFNPIGTGPYVVEEFRANDVITFVPNENYREEGKPFFDRVVWKGGGDAESAARAVLETGEADYSWNLQISPEVLSSMEAAGLGRVIFGFATNVERIMVNQTNPDPDLGELRSEIEGGPHPFLTDPAVYQALSMAIDRQTLSDVGYGITGRPACNVWPADTFTSAASTNNDACLVQDIDGANALLDEAGYLDTDGDGVRETPDGDPMFLIYQTSTNSVRQNFQALVKQWWAEIGVDTELRNIDAAVFFGGDPASPDTYGKFWTDVEMYTNGSPSPDPEVYMSQWACANASGAANNWLGNNVPRFCSAEYDALVAQMAATGDPDGRAALTVQMNDILVQQGAMIPLVYRSSVSAVSNTIAGVEQNNPWDSEVWNIADWTRAG